MVLAFRFRPFGDHDSLGDAIVDGSPIRVDEVLEETEEGLKRGGAVSERPLERVPQREPVMNQSDGADLHDPLADRGSVFRCSSRHR